MKHLVVIGAGVVGLSTAYYAQRAGWEVTVLERESETHEGTSFGNAGMIVPSHFVPLASPGMLKTGLKLMLNRKGPLGFVGLHRPEMIAWVLAYLRHANRGHVERSQREILEMNLFSKQAYVELAAEFGDFGLTEKGLLMICGEQASLEEEAHVAETAAELGLRANVLSASQVQALNPDIEVKCAGGVHFLDDAWISPPRFLAELKSRLGDCVHYDQNVTAISATLVTAGKEISYDQLVIAAGFDSPRLATMVGERFLVQPGKGYGFSVSATCMPSVCGILVEARVAVTPNAEGVRFTSGMVIGDATADLDPGRLERFKQSVGEFLPSFPASSFDGLTPWVGYRPCTPTGLPEVRRLSATQILATGHGMMGMSLGPGTGKVVAEML